VPRDRLQRAESPRILEAELVVVDRQLLAFSVEVIVGRMVAERVGEDLRIAHQYAASLERCVEPFVRIDRHGVSQCKGFEIVRGVGEDGCRSAVGTVHMEKGSGRVRQRLATGLRHGAPTLRLNLWVC
jgi:hypothetical protein